MPGLWYVGAIVAVVGSIASNLGVNCQKYSFIQNSKLALQKQRSYFCQGKWLLGMFLVIVGSVGDFAALSLAAQSIVAPVGSVTLVANLFFASIWLKEKLTKRDVIGTILIIGGCTISVAFGDHEEREYNLTQLQDYYSGTAFVIYAAIAGSLCLALYAILKLRIEPPRRELDRLLRQLDEYPDPNVEEAQRITADLLLVESRYAKVVRLHPFCYCALSGILGAQSILFGKMVAELIRASIGGDNQMVYPLTYVFLFSMLGFVACQLHFLARGLALFDALYVVPLFQSFFITVSTVGGACYFLEFADFTALQTILFPIGIIVTIAGVVLLSSRKVTRAQRHRRSGAQRPHGRRASFQYQKRKKSVSPAVSEANSLNQSSAQSLGWTVDLQSPRGRQHKKSGGDLLRSATVYQQIQEEEEDVKRLTSENGEEVDEKHLPSGRFPPISKSPTLVQTVRDHANYDRLAVPPPTFEHKTEANNDEEEERRERERELERAVENESHRQLPASVSEASFTFALPPSSSSVSTRHEAIALTMPLSASFPARESRNTSPNLGPQRAHTTLSDHLLRAQQLSDEEDEDDDMDDEDDLDVTTEVALPGLQLFSHALTAAGTEIVSAIGASVGLIHPNRRRPSTVSADALSSSNSALPHSISTVAAASAASGPSTTPATTPSAAAAAAASATGSATGTGTGGGGGRHVTYRVEVTREDGLTQQQQPRHQNQRYGAL